MTKSAKDLQELYFQYVFGEKIPSFNRRQAALDRAHEIRQFEIRLYWQRSLFFWGFMLTLFWAYSWLYDMDGRDNIINFTMADHRGTQENLILLGVSVFGLFTSLSWASLEKGSKAWQKNWEYHIDYLEDSITGKLHKTALGDRDEFYSVSGILGTFIGAIIGAWCLLLVLSSYELFCSAKEDYPQINWCYYIIFSILIFAIPFILMFWFTCKTRSCCLRGAWKTSPNTIPKKGVSLGKINLYQRELSDGKKNWKLRVIKKAKRICRTILTTIFNEMARIKRDLLLQTMGNNKSAGLPRQ